MKTEIAPRATIAQLVGIRDRAIARFGRIEQETRELNEMIKPLNEHAHRLPLVTATADRRSYYGTSPETYRKALDAAAWDHLMEKTELRDLMSTKQKADWQKGLETDPPEFTLENACATFEAMRNDSAAIFRQGLIDVFEALPRDFRSHDGFKIGARCVMCYAVTNWGGHASWQYASHGHDKRGQLGDLDRTLHAITGKPWTVNAADVAAAAMQEGATECETAFFRLRWFKNGNLHVWFTDPQAVKDANKILADHYGARLGYMHLHPDQRRRA